MKSLKRVSSESALFRNIKTRAAARSWRVIYCTCFSRIASHFTRVEIRWWKIIPCFRLSESKRISVQLVHIQLSEFFSCPICLRTKIFYLHILSSCRASFSHCSSDRLSHSKYPVLRLYIRLKYLNIWEWNEKKIILEKTCSFNARAKN